MATSLVHVNLPASGSSRAPSSLTLQPLPLLSILNHFTRRPTASQTRVIGALLGKRTEAGEVVITNSFAVPHDEARLFFAESEYKSMLESIRKVSGDKESLVGWYSTAPTPDVFSALIQNFFSAETAPYPAVHVTVDISAEGNEEGLGVKGWISSPVGITPNEYCSFLPIPLSLAVSNALHSIQPSAASAAPSATTPLSELEASLSTTRADLARVRAYVDAVVKGEQEGDAEVGRALMDVCGRIGEGEDWEKKISGQLQDALMVSYLSSLVRSQVELASRINLVQT